MNTSDIIFIAIGLAMDAFAVSICKGLSCPKKRLNLAVTAGLYFGFFQILMPLLGYMLGDRFGVFIEAIDHWVAFFLLGFIGISMIRESRDPASADNEGYSAKIMLPLAVATSIDAFAVGITFAFLKVEIVLALCIIGAVAFAFSFLGVYLGVVFGAKLKQKAEIFGGVILIVIGTKILLEHTGII